MGLSIRLAVALAAIVWIGGATAAEPGADAKGVQEVVVVFKTHFDIGYTKMAAAIVERYRTTMIDDALAVVDQSRTLPPEQQFAWTLPGWPLAKILDPWPGQQADRARRVREAFREGRFVVHALPFSLHTETLEPEDLVRGLGFASRLSRADGLPLPRDAKMTDVPCHTWLVPTLLTQAGVQFFHIGCNSACTSPEVPRLFWWEGPDGSRLLTMYTAGGYGTGLVPPADWPYKTWLALIHTGDNHGPPRPDEVAKLLEQAKQKLPGVKVRIGRLSDFADRIRAEHAELPVVRADMPDTWIHGPMSDPQGARLARNVRPALAAAESLGTELRAWGIDSPPAADTIAQAYEQSLLYGEHTWGGALYWLTPYGKNTRFSCDLATWKAQRQAGRFAKLEASWAEHTHYIETAQKLVEPLLGSTAERLAKAVKVDGRRWVVFNPLPWKRGGWVDVTRESPRALKSADQGQAVPSEDRANGVRFLAADVPAMGYRTYVPADAPATASDLSADPGTSTIESPFFKAVLDTKRGAIRSLVDKKSGRELVDASAPWGLGQYLYERFDADQVAAYLNAYLKIRPEWATAEVGKPNMPPASQVPYRAVSPKNCTLTVRQTPLSAEAVMGCTADEGLKHRFELRVVLHREEPCVDLELTLLDKPADPWPEAGWICLPLKIAQPRFRLGRPGSIIDPATDIVPGANRHLCAINTGVAVTDADGHGVGICPMDHFLVSLDRPGCLLYSKDFVPRRPYVFLNLFNNLWTTNFRMWNEGTIKSRVRLWAYEHYDAQESLIRPALEARHPLVVAAAAGPGGSLPPTQAGVEIDRPGVFISALGSNPDGEGIVLRLWELAGRSGDCRVRLPGNLSRASVQPVDLRGQPQGKPIDVRDGTFVVPLGGFEPRSVVLKVGSRDKRGK